MMAMTLGVAYADAERPPPIVALAAVGMFLLGGVFSAQFGMSAVYGARAGFSVGQISLFVSAIYLTALVAQFPIGWISDRLDRRILIIAVALVGGGNSAG